MPLALSYGEFLISLRAIAATAFGPMSNGDAQVAYDALVACADRGTTQQPDQLGALVAHIGRFSSRQPMVPV